MGFRNATSCSCCATEPCDCECPDGGTPAELLIDIPAFGPGQSIGCGICEDLDGLYSLPRGYSSEAYFTPINGETFRCSWAYESDIMGPYYCGNYEPIYYFRQIIEARTFCAYQKDGHIYTNWEKPEGATLVGRAFEVIMRLQALWSRIYLEYPEDCYSVNIKDPTDDFFSCAYGVYNLMPSNGYDPSYCCNDPYNIDGENTTTYDCDYCLPNDVIIHGIGQCGGQAYGKWVWRSIFSTNRKCLTFEEGFRLVDDQEEIERRQITSWRNRRKLSEDECKVVVPLCDAPIVINVEGV